MKLLIINPNTNTQTTERMRQASEAVASNGTSIEMVTARFGAKTIKTIEQSERAAEAVMTILDEYSDQIDAAIIAAYSDPGLLRAKATCSFPVFGIGEASMREAATIADRFSIVTMGFSMVDYLKHRMKLYGIDGELASVRILPWSVTEGTAKDVESLTAECHEAIYNDGAEAVIVGGGPLAGFAQKISQQIKQPVLDGNVSAIRLAEKFVSENN